MKNKYLQPYLVVWFSLLFSSFAHAYPDAWSDFDPGDLNEVRDETMGNTQEMLADRGSVECIACHGETDDHYEGVVNSFDIIESTMSAALSCLDWEIRGGCVWASCAGPVCWVDGSVKVKNFVPDLTIQAYDRANGEPWTESQDINQVSQGDADSSFVTTLISWVEDFDVGDVGIRGGVSTQAKEEKKASLHFKLVDAYGNPAIIPFNGLAELTMGFICGGTTTPFFPYYISNLDSIAWRWNIPEMFYPQSWAGFIIYDLGSVTNNYGAIYPRHGFITTEDPLKAAVLASFRAAHFITRTATPHLYFTIDKNSEDGYWPPDSLDDDDSDTGQWQMVYPDNEGNCHDFPYGGFPGYSKRSSDGSYVWNFWRAYKCCERRGHVLIWHEG